MTWLNFTVAGQRVEIALIPRSAGRVHYVAFRVGEDSPWHSGTVEKRYANIIGLRDRLKRESDRRGMIAALDAGDEE